MPWLAFTDDEAALDVEGREQGRRAVTLVVVRHRGGAALFHRQAGLRAIERLDLALLVNTEHESLVRRAHVEADDVGDLFLEQRIVRNLERVLSDAASIRPRARWTKTPNSASDQRQTSMKGTQNALPLPT